VVQNTNDGAITHLNNAACFAQEIAACPTRYVLSDDLTRLCTALAYSKGASTLSCADCLRIPAECVWVEWCELPWRMELNRYGFRNIEPTQVAAGRRGIFIRSDPTGRSGSMRSFWTLGEADTDVLASSMEAYFDFDTPEGEAPVAPDSAHRPNIHVFDDEAARADILHRCFRFRYEVTWAQYYANAKLSPKEAEAIARHALGAIAIKVPVVLAFLLLLASRPALPRRPLGLERLNRSRTKSGKLPLLEHVEVFSPLLAEYPAGGTESANSRRPSRLHHVRGHLVRRGSQLFWRVPHLRGSARAGIIRSRTVTWTVG
jgi:hypothetical protein